MMQAQWKLRAYLQAHGITPYRLAKALPEMRQATIYRLAAEETPQSVSFDVLSQVIAGLRRVTGEDVTPNDLIAIVETRSAEDTSWQTADLSRLADEEPYDWGGVDPLTLGKAVHVTASGEIAAEQ
ncbi:helix-turn-helix domain-containing protein [Deinococcus knuensis]|uniref:HTH cro/C1-type domain-containing protein n=1 Tax=Deinococcus knuensis TaxID=1837380 RepID=A0ABQ2SU69_9DEIO|nr:helix-turn-helix transcriptional regulator [Deinococcus knuensis]GGS40560.1 hypothetical protein GCM10008961_34840 [Deinococcus knuensis]